jgi:hypothetical protein
MLFGLKKPLKREAGWIGIIAHARIPTPPIFPHISKMETLRMTLARIAARLKGMLNRSI